LISSGTFVYPKDEALKIAISTVSEFLLNHDILVYLLVYDKESHLISEKLFTEIEKYIDDNYVAEQHQLSSGTSLMPFGASLISDVIKWGSRRKYANEASPIEKKKRSLEDMVNHLDESFSQRLLRFIDERGMTDVEAYKRANLDRKLFSKIRMTPEINDNGQQKYSNYQIAEAVNTVLSIVFNALSQSNNELITEEIDLTLTDGATDLPEAFLSVVNIFSPLGKLTQQSKSKEVDNKTYRIRKNKIYSANDTLHLVYKPYFVEIDPTDLTSELPVPNYFSELLKKYAIMALQGGINKADASIVQQITDDVYRLTAGREYSEIEFNPTFKV
jgi:hypothetical protein